MDSVEQMQQQCVEDSIEWFDEDLVRDLGYNTLALVGEAGELANLVKKRVRQQIAGNPHDTETWDEETWRLQTAMECADVLIYLCLVASNLGIDLGKVYDVKREYNAGRFGDGTPASDNGSASD